MRKVGYALLGFAVVGFALPWLRGLISFRLPLSDLDAVGWATIFVFAGTVAVLFSPRPR